MSSQFPFIGALRARKSKPTDPGSLNDLRTRREQLADMLAIETERHARSSFDVGKDIANHIRWLERNLAGTDAQIENELRLAGVLRDEPLSVGQKILAAFVLTVIAAILVVPFWIVAYPPLLDYPNHLARAFILAHINDAHFQFSQYYAADWGPYPYLTMDVALNGFQRVCSVITGGRILLSFSVLALPLAASFFVRQANPRNASMACWSLLAACNVFFLWGFVNWQIGTALVLIVVGLWIRYLRAPSLPRWFVIAVVVTALYFTHLQGFGLAGLVVTAYTALTVRGWRRVLHTLTRAWLLFLPGGGLHLMTRIRSHDPSEGWSFYFHPLSDKWDGLSYFIQGYSPRLDQITVLVLALCAIAAWWRNREFRWNHPWPAITAGLFLLYWIFPGYGIAGSGGDADIRLLPFIFLLTPVVAHAGRRSRWLALVALALFFARSETVITTFVRAQPELAGISRAFSLTPLNARVLPIVESKDDDPQHRPYAHFWAYGLIERGWFSPYLLTIKRVTPLEVKADLTSPDGFWDLEYTEEPEWEDIADEYDYVWAYHVPRFARELQKIGTLVYRNGDLELYQIKKEKDDDSTDRPESPFAPTRKSIVGYNAALGQSAFR